MIEKRFRDLWQRLQGKKPHLAAVESFAFSS